MEKKDKAGENKIKKWPTKKEVLDTIRFLAMSLAVVGGAYWVAKQNLEQENYRKDLITQIEEIEDRRGNGNGKLDYNEFANVYQVIDEETSETSNLSFDSAQPFRKLTTKELEVYLNEMTKNGYYDKI